MACAIMSCLPPETGLTTSELSLRMLRPVRPGGTVTARASVIELGSTLALAEASVTEGHGALVAHATSLCVLLSLPATRSAADGTASPRSDEAAASSTHDDDAGALPDPWQRTALGELVPTATSERLTGLEVMREQIADTLHPKEHVTVRYVIVDWDGTPITKMFMERNSGNDSNSAGDQKDRFQIKKGDVSTLAPVPTPTPGN